MTTIRRVSAMVCAFACSVLPAVAAAPPPDPALLEFLGDWDDGAGGVVDWEMMDAQLSTESAVEDAPPAGAEEGDDVSP